ncbi:hypothetical protein [Ilumatobacter sp.]|uniref:hypothetical protein n=1 Tax=Ilumatobacter sp. TaxID=1967498 RepID=UPI003B52AF49
MDRRTFLTLLTATPALGVVAACGSDAIDDAAAPAAAPDETLPPATDPPAELSTPPTTDSPTGTAVPASDAPGDLVLSYTESGGFTTREYAFQDPPLVLITAGGQFITTAVTTQEFPPPAVPQHLVRPIDPAGIDAIVSSAADAGLLADVEYERDDLIADASTATLAISTDEGTWTHEAYALGIGGGPGLDGGESTDRRRALADFLDSLVADPGSLIGAGELGEPSAWEPPAYQIVAEPAPEADPSQPEPTVLDWPGSSGVDLATASGCTEVSAESLGPILADADALTRFRQGGVTYAVTVRPAYPGREC